MALQDSVPPAPVVHSHVTERPESTEDGRHWPDQAIPEADIQGGDARGVEALTYINRGGKTLPSPVIRSTFTTRPIRLSSATS
jgi:hypothetical protein